MRALAAVAVAGASLIASCSKEGLDADEVPPVTVTGTPLAAAVPPGTPDPAIGTTAPKLSGTDYGENPVTIDPAQGPTMIVFLAHWCPHCNSEVPRLIEWKNSGQAPASLRVYGVTTSARPNADNYPPSEWVRAIRWPWPVLADNEAGDAAQAYGLRSFPYFVITGADGKVKVRFAGEIGAADLTRVVNQALAS